MEVEGLCSFCSAMSGNPSVTRTTAYLNGNKTGTPHRRAPLTQLEKPVEQAGCRRSAFLAELAVLHHGVEDVPHLPGLSLNQLDDI